MATVFADDYGFSSVDSTVALQAAINDPNADKIIVRDMGSPWLIDKQIVLQSNKEIVFEEGVVVQAKPGSFLANDQAMFVGQNIENIKLTGQGSEESLATLKMNKEEYNSNQFGHVISLLGVQNYQVSGLRLTGGGGDGLHIAGGSFERPDPNVLSHSANGVVENIVSDNNRRQGLSIDSAKNLVVRNSSFINTSGTEPSAGINLEPTWDFESLENIKIENVDLRGNAGNGIQMPLGNLDNSSAPVSVNFSNVTLNNSKNNAIFISSKYLADGASYGSEFKGEANKSIPNGEINGTINFDNVNISNSEAIANSGGDNNPPVYVFVEGISGNQNEPNNLKINFNQLNVNDPTDTTVKTTPIFIQGLAGDNNPREIGNISFQDSTIQGNYSLDVVRADLARSDSNLSNIFGDITVYNANQTGAGSFFANQDQAENFDLNVIQGTGEAPSAVDSSNIDEFSIWNTSGEDISAVDYSEGGINNFSLSDELLGGNSVGEDISVVDSGDFASKDNSNPTSYGDDFMLTNSNDF